MIPQAMPERIGRYAVLGLLGSGGMARVYLGRTVGIGRFERLAAIKVIHRELSMDEQFVRMLLDEAWISARVQHPNVVSVHEVDREGMQYYLVMDYVKGESLDRMLARTKEPKGLPLELAAYVAIEVAEALHAIHDVRDTKGERLNVIHRDVTPQNIMIGYDGTVRLMDLGVAKTRERIQEITLPGFLKGTVGYLAPEQIERGPVDHRADVFALGVVLWELIAGKPLFPNNLATIMHTIVNGAIPRPSTVAPECSAELDAIIMRALDRDPARRTQSARELGQQLRRVLMEMKRYPGPVELETFVRTLFAERFEKLDDMVRRAAALDLASAPSTDVQRLWNDFSSLAELEDDEPTQNDFRPPRRKQRWELEETPLVEDAGALDGEPTRSERIKE